MRNLRRRIAALRAEEGQALLEYGMLLAFISVGLLASLSTFGQRLAALLFSIAARVPGGA
jgi:Flp pilus assembly pilin Flp